MHDISDSYNGADDLQFHYSRYVCVYLQIGGKFLGEDSHESRGGKLGKCSHELHELHQEALGTLEGWNVCTLAGLAARGEWAQTSEISPKHKPGFTQVLPLERHFPRRQISEVLRALGGRDLPAGRLSLGPEMERGPERARSGDLCPS